MAILRIWFSPRLRFQGTQDVPGVGSVTISEADSTEREGKRVGLMSATVPGDDIDGPYADAWTAMQEYFDLRAFAELSSATILAARVEEEVGLGNPCRWRMYVGPPPTRATIQIPYGFPRTQRSLSELPSEIAPAVRSAISWFLKALRSNDPYERTMFLWAALEALAPEVKEPTRCNHCNEHELKCPRCGREHMGFRVLEGIRRTTAQLQSAPKPIVGRLYGKRSKIVHGRAELSLEESKELGLDGMRLLVITLEAIARELGWESRGPDIEMKGQMISAVQMNSETVFKTEALRERLLHPTLESIDGLIFGVPGGFGVQPEDWDPSLDNRVTFTGL